MTSLARHTWNSNTYKYFIMEINIRDCRKEDASEVAWLFMMAWPVEEFLAMDPSMTEEDLHDRVQRYVEADNTLYSFRHTIVAEADGKVCGAINGYDGASYEELKRPVAEDLASLPDSTNDFSKVKETEAGEFYLDSIGVDPSMRSHGIGSKLFEAAFNRARRLGFRKTGLIVDTDKPKAEALYRRLGFSVVGMRDFFGHEMKHMQKDLQE